MEQNIATRYVFLMMLAIANESGIVVGTEIAIARRLNMDLVLFQSSIANLTMPDPNSNSKEHEGRRIVESESPRGYTIVNYLKYQSEGDQAKPASRREYMRGYMERHRAKSEEGDLFGTPQKDPQESQGKAAQKNLPTTETAIRIAGLKKRRLTTPWSVKEIKAFKAIGNIPEEDLLAMEAYYASDCEYLRRDMLTLLNNWQGEVDRAHEYISKSKKPQHRALQESIDPEGWRDFLSENGQPYTAYKTAKSYLKEKFRDDR